MADEIKEWEVKFNSYFRKSKHSIEETLQYAGNGKSIFKGDKVNMSSDRLILFMEKGTKCVCCGLEASYFAKERTFGTQKYHLNLWGVDNNGKHILFTKDHIKPKSKGGSNTLDNYQTMCHDCNVQKGSNYHRFGLVSKVCGLFTPKKKKVSRSAIEDKDRQIENLKNKYSRIIKDKNQQIHKLQLKNGNQKRALKEINRM